VIQALGVISGGSELMKILVVDDNTDSADMLAALLCRRGHQVQVAYDGPAALDQVAQLGPDVVLLDLGLPEMDGYEVARRVRAEHPDVQLVALTGYGREQDRQRVREAGFVEHVLKPVRLDDLSRILDGLGPLERERISTPV
jgi:CheY-like chemotaxis protein